MDDPLEGGDPAGVPALPLSPNSPRRRRKKFLGKLDLVSPRNRSDDRDRISKATSLRTKGEEDLAEAGHSPRTLDSFKDITTKEDFTRKFFGFGASKSRRVRGGSHSRNKSIGDVTELPSPQPTRPGRVGSRGGRSQLSRGRGGTEEESTEEAVEESQSLREEQTPAADWSVGTIAERRKPSVLVEEEQLPASDCSGPLFPPATSPPLSPGGSGSAIRVARKRAGSVPPRPLLGELFVRDSIGLPAAKQPEAGADAAEVSPLKSTLSQSPLSSSPGGSPSHGDPEESSEEERTLGSVRMLERPAESILRGVSDGEIDGLGGNPCEWGASRPESQEFRRDWSDSLVETSIKSRSARYSKSPFKRAGRDVLDRDELVHEGSHSLTGSSPAALKRTSSSERRCSSGAWPTSPLKLPENRADRGSESPMPKVSAPVISPREHRGDALRGNSPLVPLLKLDLQRELDLGATSDQTMALPFGDREVARAIPVERPKSAGKPSRLPPLKINISARGKRPVPVPTKALPPPPPEKKPIPQALIALTAGGRIYSEEGEDLTGRAQRAPDEAQVGAGRHPGREDDATHETLAFFASDENEWREKRVIYTTPQPARVERSSPAKGILEEAERKCEFGAEFVASVNNPTSSKLLGQEVRTPRHSSGISHRQGTHAVAETTTASLPTSSNARIRTETGGTLWPWVLVALLVVLLIVQFFQARSAFLELLQESQRVHVDTAAVLASLREEISEMRLQLQQIS